VVRVRWSPCCGTTVTGPTPWPGLAKQAAFETALCILTGDETATGRCGVSAPQWGEPGYKPPGFLPRPQASRGHKRALWGTLILGLVGQAAYLSAIGGNSDTNNNGCIDGSEAVFAHPWLALAGFLIAVAALVLAVVVMRRSRHPPQGFPRFGIVIVTLTAINVGWLALLPLGGACG
jgi:hypothetical protein